MSLSHKAINFDLNTNELKKHFNNTTEAYNQIKKFMLENGFEHRQYSGYASKEVMDDDDIVLLTEKMAEQFPWLSTCIQEIDVTDIGEQYSLKDILKTKTAILNKKQSILSDNIDLDKQSKAIESVKQKIAEIERSGKPNRIANKKDKGRER